MPENPTRGPETLNPKPYTPYAKSIPRRCGGVHAGTDRERLLVGGSLREGEEFRIQGSGFRVQGLGFRV